MDAKVKEYLLLGAALVVLVLIVKKNATAIASNVAAGAVTAAADVTTGAVLGVGDVFGVPRTEESECEKAMREGRTWDASFACPAGTFLKYLTGMGA